MRRLGWFLAACAAALASPAAAAPAADRLGLAPMSEAIDAGRFRRIEAVLVERGGTVLFEDYYGDSGPESRIDARSAGKSITALAVGMAIADGALPGADMPVFPRFRDRAPFAHDAPAKQEITVADLLAMSSALDCNDWQDSPGNEEQMYDTRDWTRFALDIPLDPAWRRDPATGRGRFSYCTAGAFLLGRLVERATGQPFDTWLQRRLFDPLGITGARWTRSPAGEVQAGGQLSLRARDFAAIGRLVLNRGRHGDTQIVPVEWLREMLRVRARASPVDGYGYLWWVRDFRVPGDPTPHPGFYMSGNGGNKVVLFPEFDAVVVLLATNYNSRGMHDQTTELVERHILPALLRQIAAPAR